MHHRVRRAVGAVLSTTLLSTGLALAAAPAQAAYPVPPTPANLPTTIEALQPYIGQSTCDPVAKPGVVAFRDLLLRTYTDSGSLGIVRSCSAGGQSEHKEGRAFDWAMKVSNTRQSAEVSTLLSWLLKTDASGNTYAMARRFGIMYMIWNHRIWKAYDAARGWQTYSGPNPHTDHVHFSFGWNGAKKTTSYWDGTVASIDFGPDAPPHITPVRRVDNIATVRTYGGTTLAMHSTGTAVKVVQRELKVSPVDGDYGPDTALHVLRFQIDQHLDMTQKFGPTEWRRLFPYPINPFGGVDTPTYVLGNAVVRGWAIDADTTNPVQVSASLDGTVVETEPATVPRSDVGSRFPEWGSAHGFAFLLPVTDGTHQVCVTALNAPTTPGTNSSLGCSTVTADHDPLGALDSVVPALGSVTVTGWAADPDTAATVPTSLTVDGAPVEATFESVTRTDVGQQLPGLGDQHGVTTVVQLPEGTHQVCLRAANAAGTPGADTTIGCRSVSVQHTPVGSVDYVRTVPTGVSVRGWALDPDVTSPSTVQVLSDGAVVTTTTASFARTGIPAAYSANGTAHGFTTTFPLPTGSHQVCLRVPNAAGTAGNDLLLPCTTVVVSHDAAGASSLLGTVPGGSVRVTGDAYDPDTLQPVQVVVTADKVQVRVLTASLSSTTAAARWPGYGAGHGYATYLSLSRGRHYVCVSARNVTGTPGVTRLIACRWITVHDGAGALTSTSRSWRTVTVRGWTLDPDSATANRATLVVDGSWVSTVRATATRSSLATLMPGYGTGHGVTFVRTLTRGTHRVCLVSRNLTGTAGVSAYAGCRTITVP